MPEESIMNSNESPQGEKTEVFDDYEYELPDENTQTPSEQPEDFFVAEDYGDSFSALMESMQQGHDLKMKRKALDEYNKTLDTLKLAHADRVNIAENYDSVVAEQERIINDCSSAIKECASKSKEVDSRIAAANEELAVLKRSQAEALKPLEDEMKQREAMLRSVKEEYRQVRSQRDSLDLFEEGQSSDGSSADTHDQIVGDVEAKYNAAKDSRKAAQKALDAQERANKSEQKVIQDSIKKMNVEKNKISKEAQEIKKKLDAAKERIAFCKHVIEHPEQTESMKQRIMENEKTAASMAEQIDQLASVHSKSVAKSSKARTVVIIGVVAVVIIAILFIYLANR